LDCRRAPLINVFFWQIEQRQVFCIRDNDDPRGYWVNGKKAVFKNCPRPPEKYRVSVEL
jgi:hypothetical protein